MPFNPHSFLQEEILTQPDDWARVVSRVDEARAALPPVGARLAVVGCGTSFYMAQAYAALRERAGQGETDAFAASEHRLHRGYDAVLVITRSGTTTEVLEVLTELKRRGTPTTAIVATAGTPATELADRVILLSEVDEQSVVQTRFATTALALLRASPRRGPHRRHRGRPRGAGAGRGAGPGRPGGRRAAHLPRPRLDRRAGRGGGAEAARVGPAVDRVLPRDGVPPRPDQHRGAGAGDLGVRGGAGGPGRAGARRPAPASSTATSTRWPTSSACTGSAWPRPGRPTWTPTTPAP